MMTNKTKIAVFLSLIIMMMARTADASPAPKPELLPAGCVSDSRATTVLNVGGWDSRIFGFISLDLPANADRCDVRLENNWDDREVRAMHDELDALIDSGDRIVLVGYSMSGPFIGEVLDTWHRLDAEPELLDRIDLVLVAPAAGVSGGLRGFVRSRADRWSHAWSEHFERGVLGRNHLVDWNHLIDRIVVVLAGKERVVRNSEIAQQTLDRLGNNVVVLDDATHLDLRFRDEVSERVTRLLLRVPE